jgi:hypothetical protein
MADSVGQDVGGPLLAPLSPSQDVNKEHEVQRLSLEVAGNIEANDEKTDVDRDCIGWEGDDDPENPKNWPESRKWGMVVLLSFVTFLTLATLFPAKQIKNLNIF